MKKFVLIFLLLIFLFTAGCRGEEHDILGTWEDVNDKTFKVVFDVNETYTDSVYGVQLPCTPSEDGALLYNSAAGDVCYAPYSWKWGGNLMVEIGGMRRELRRVSSQNVTAKYEAINESAIASEYTLKSQLGVQSVLRVDDKSNAEFELNFGSTDDDVSNAVMGKSAISTVSHRLVFYFENGKEFECFNLSESGTYITSLPLKSDGVLQSDVSYSNPSLAQRNGYTLDGTVLYDDGSIYYRFQSDGICIKTSYTGVSLEYNYYVDTEGLITLAAKGALGSYDYMFLDVEDNIIYRLVYQRNSWQDYLSSMLYTESHSSDASTTECVVLPGPTPTSGGTALIANPLDNALGYCDLPSYEIEFTSTVLQQIQDIQDSIKEDDIARREYELSLLSEQERLAKQAREIQEERARLQALMDARVQAEIESGRGGTPSSKSPDWWDDFLSQINTPNSYDQDEQVSSPVVNSHAPTGNVGGGSADPSTEPPTPEDVPSVSPEPTASNNSVSLTVTFVCTCVNCHVQSMPVEVGTDNVLLVDDAIFSPGNLLNIEGYGVVVSRASGGATSGQTAICYSGSHNAVSRFPSGVYTVSKVVG